MVVKQSIFFLFSILYLADVSAQRRIPYYTDISPTEGTDQILTKAASLVPTQRQFNWQQLELTAFLHFGINTFTDREWGDGTEDPKLFNPAALDADQWVKTCKAAGFKLVILTAKHHDGFCLWPSQYTGHSVKSSSWKNGAGDVVKEVAAACKKYGIGFGIYISPWDRHSRLYGTEAYNTYFANQLTELLTQYGKVDEVWFDGANGEGPNGKKQVYDFEGWYRIIRRLQPGAVIAVMGPDVRWVGTETGRGRETEWSVVPISEHLPEQIAARSQTNTEFKPSGDMRGDDLGSREKIKNAKGLLWYPAETDVSIRPGWFYHEREDARVKTPKQLLDIYFSSVGRNGVLLLNIPPNKKGRIQTEDSLHLMQWRNLLQETFQTNLAAKASITLSSGGKAKHLIDGRYKTWWTPLSSKDTTADIVITLSKSQTFDVLLLQENIRVGQRIEKFTAEYWNGDQWTVFANGTTVGYKRLLQFPAVSAQKVRIRILASRLNPTLSEVGLYKLSSVSD